MQNAHQVYKELDYFIKLSLLSLLALDEDTGFLRCVCKMWAAAGQCFIRRNILFNQPHN